LNRHTGVCISGAADDFARVYCSFLVLPGAFLLPYPLRPALPLLSPSLTPLPCSTAAGANGISSRVTRLASSWPCGAGPNGANSTPTTTPVCAACSSVPRRQSLSGVTMGRRRKRCKPGRSHPSPSMCTHPSPPPRRPRSNAEQLGVIKGDARGRREGGLPLGGQSTPPSSRRSATRIQKMCYYLPFTHTAI